MALYRRVFSIPDVAARHREFLAVIKTAEAVEEAWAKAGKPGVAVGTVRTLRAAYLNFNRGLDQLAVDTAAEAKRNIVSLLKARQLRPNTGMGPHLAGAIVCRPINDFGLVATGEVGIADIERLNRVVNPFGQQYGPYWRAIEQGSTRAVGRTIIGGFFGTGLASGPFAADPGQFRRHPIFVTSAAGRSMFADGGHNGGFGPQGGGGGRRMTIGKAIKAQNFIRDGADAAEVRWRARLAAVEARAIREIAAVTRPLP